MKNPDRHLPDSPDAGVGRLSKKPLAALMVIGAVVGLILIWSIAESGKKAAVIASEPKELGHASIDSLSIQNLLERAPERGGIAAKADSVLGGPNSLNGQQVISRAISPSAGPVSNSTGPAETPLSIEENKRRQEVRNAVMEERRRVAKRRQQLLEAAMASQTQIGAGSPALSREFESSSGRALTPSQQILNLPSAATLASLASQSQSSDQNDQAGKEAFREKPRPPSYHVAVRQRQVSPFELKAGTVIPAVTITGINSDLPGNIIAQVSQDVYDTTTGKILLIPQGSKLIGEYSSRIVWGQERALQVWTQINFPDGSSFDLGGMDGVSQDGMAGFEDKVNKHYARIFGSAIMLSLFSAGIEYSQGDSNRGWGERPSVGSTVSASIGQQLAQVGAELMRKEMNVQPTITIRPGHLFHVFVKKDLILEPSDEEKARHGY